MHEAGWFLLGVDYALVSVAVAWLGWGRREPAPLQ